MTFFTAQSTLGSKHKALFQRVTLIFGSTLAATIAFASFATFTAYSILASFALALVGRAFAVFSLASTECVITAPQSQRR